MGQGCILHSSPPLSKYHLFIANWMALLDGDVYIPLLGWSAASCTIQVNNTIIYLYKILYIVSNNVIKKNSTDIVKMMHKCKHSIVSRCNIYRTTSYMKKKLYIYNLQILIIFYNMLIYIVLNSHITFLQRYMLYVSRLG
jgi:hypothetical protein